MSGSGSGSNDGVFGALVDFEFTRYATPKLVKILYILTFVVIVIGGLFFLVSAFATGEPLAMIAALIVTPIVVLLYLIYARVGLELLSVVFRIGEDVRSISQPGSAGASPFGPGSQGPPPGGGPAGGPYGGPPPGGPMAPPSGPPVGGAPSGSWPS